MRMSFSEKENWFKRGDAISAGRGVVSGKWSFPEEKIRVVAPHAPEMIAASLNWMPVFTACA